MWGSGGSLVNDRAPHVKRGRDKWLPDGICKVQAGPTWYLKRFSSLSLFLPLLAAPALSHWWVAEGLQHNLAALLWKRNAPWSWGSCVTLRAKAPK